MTKERNRADARFNRASGTKAATSERDIAAKAVLDNMARLKALRLAREAAEPPRPRSGQETARQGEEAAAKRRPALADWLAGQQSGGRRT